MKKLLAFAFALFAIASLQAQKQNPPPPPHHAPPHDKSPEMKAARKVFFENTELSVRKAQHKIMLTKLNSEDLLFIATKRREKAILDQKMHDLQLAMHRTRRTGMKPHLVDQQFEPQRKAHREELDAFFVSMSPFMTSHKVAFEPIRAELKKVEEQWKSERKTIHEREKANHNPPPPPANKKAVSKAEKAREKADEKEKESRKKHEKEAREKHHEHRFIDFILWDGITNPKPAKKGNDKEEERAANELTNPLEMRAYPNPAQNQTTISMDLLQGVNLMYIRIIDTQGRTVYMQTFKNMPAGEQKIELDLSNIGAGTYFYSIIADKKTSASTLVIESK